MKHSVYVKSNQNQEMKRAQHLMSKSLSTDVPFQFFRSFLAKQISNTKLCRVQYSCAGRIKRLCLGGMSIIRGDNLSFFA